MSIEKTSTLIRVFLGQIDTLIHKGQSFSRTNTMRILDALAILEAATLECKKREVDTPELRAALDLLEPHIQPTWLIPQFRHNLDGEQEHDYPAREGQQQIFRVTFPGIRNSVRELLGKRAML